MRNNKNPDWITEAINSPVGKVTQALMETLHKKDLKNGCSFPIGWLAYADELCKLKDDLYRYALVIFAFNMNWFYAKDPVWTESNILSVLDKGDESDQFATWSGFFWGAKIPDQNLYMRLKPNLLVLAKQHSLPHRRFSEVFVSIILDGWGSTHEDTGEHYISNDEMHDVLLYTDEEFLQRILRKVKWWSKHENKNIAEKWSVKLIELLRDVWPRQKSLKIPKISACLCELAFSNVERFPELAEIILPLLTTFDSDYLMLPQLNDSLDSIIEKYPRQTLDILHAVLPDNVTIWPHGIEAILKKLRKADESLRFDKRLIELNRKWNSR